MLLYGSGYTSNLHLYAFKFQEIKHSHPPPSIEEQVSILTKFTLQATKMINLIILYHSSVMVYCLPFQYFLHSIRGQSQCQEFAQPLQFLEFYHEGGFQFPSLMSL